MQRRTKPAEQVLSRGGQTDGAAMAAAQEGTEQLPKANQGVKGCSFWQKPMLVALPYAWHQPRCPAAWSF